MSVGVFTFATPNLGDEMQSFAVLAHLRRVDRLLDRDHLADHQSDSDVTCVFNSWFMLGSDFRLPSSRVRPIWHGFSGGREELLQEPWLSYLTEQGPIGCRDLFTTESLREKGIAAEWTGCLTLFLGRALTRPQVDRQGVLFVDVPPAAEAHIPLEVRRRAVRMSTFPAPGILEKPLERWATVARIVHALARAELVVTRRLHVALPAASFGTPVVAVPDPEISATRRRFSGFDTMLPTVYLDDAESGLRRIDWRNVEPARVPDVLEERYAAFCAGLGRRGIAATDDSSSHVLDRADRDVRQLVNIGGRARPEQLRLRLADRVFDLSIRFWSDRYVDVALVGFPGLSKFDFHVECCAHGQDHWESWGRLRDLVEAAADRCHRAA